MEVNTIFSMYGRITITSCLRMITMIVDIGFRFDNI